MEDMQVRALYDFHPASDQELGFSQGDIIYYVEVVDDNWWRGTTQDGRNGLFPCFSTSNYVEAITSSASAASTAQTPTTSYSSPVATTTTATYSPAASASGTASTSTSAASGQLNLSVRAVWDYEGQSETELSLRKGDVLTVIEKDAEDVWWHGVITQGGVERKGWFPGTYVEEITSSSPAAVPVPRAPAAVASPSYGGPSTAYSTPTNASVYSPPAATPAVSYGAPARTTIPISAPSIQPDFSPPSSPHVEAPPPQKEIKKEKIGKDTFAFLEVHIFECDNLVAPKKGASVQISLKEWGKLRKVFQTTVLKKTHNFIWNESFQLNIVDPEDTDLVISMLDGKKAVGEIELPLRASKRTQFEDVGGLDNKWPLQGKEASGTLHMNIKYRDVNAISKPAQFVKDQSVNLSGGTIVTSNLSPEWNKVFQAADLAAPSQHAPVAVTPTPVQAAPQVASPPASFNKPSPPAGFKPPPPAGPRPTAPAAASSSVGRVQPQGQAGFRHPPPAGPLPAVPPPGRGISTPSYQAPSSPALNTPSASPAPPAGFKPPPPAGPRPAPPAGPRPTAPAAAPVQYQAQTQASPGFRPPPPAGPRPTPSAPAYGYGAQQQQQQNYGYGQQQQYYNQY